MFLRRLLWLVNTLMLVVVGLALMLLCSTFGDYSSSVYDLFLVPFLLLLYLILAFLLYYQTKNRIGNKLVYWLLAIPFLFMLVAAVWEAIYHKKVVYVGQTMEPHLSFDIRLFDDHSFEIRVQRPHVAYFMKGKYERTQNDLYLKNFDSTYFFSKKISSHYIFKNDSLLVPADEDLPAIELIQRPNN